MIDGDENWMDLILTAIPYRTRHVTRFDFDSSRKRGYTDKRFSVFSIYALVRINTSYED